MGAHPGATPAGSPLGALRAGAGLCRGEGCGRGSLGLGPLQGPAISLTMGRGVTQSSSSLLQRQSRAVTSLGRSLMPCHRTPTPGLALSLGWERGEKGTVL